MTDRPKDEPADPGEKPAAPPPAGPHADPDLTDPDKTPGAGTLPDPDGGPDPDATAG